MNLLQQGFLQHDEILAACKIAILCVDDRDMIQYINAFARVMLGLSAEQSYTGTALKCISENLIFDVPEYVFLVKTELQHWKKSIIDQPSGSIKVYRGTTISLRDSSIGSSAVQYLVSHQKEDPNEVHINKIIECLPELVYWKDRSFTYRGCNQNTCQMLGLERPNDINGKTDYDFGWGPDRIQQLREVDLAVINEGLDSVVEDAIPINGILRIHVTSKTPLRNDQGDIIGILGISTDISERKEMEEKLKIAKDAAETSDRAKTEFITNMSHDIRTPLSGVVGLAGIIESEVTDETHKQYAHSLVNSGKELLNMLNEILDAASANYIEEGKIQESTFNLLVLIENIVSIEQPSIVLKQIQLITHMDKGIPKFLKGDYKKIHHILLNLIGNSIKFTEVGYVAIVINILEKQVDTIHLNFQVIDTGQGVEEEDLDKIFDVFYRATPSYKGVDKGHGLGLHIAQSYAHLMGSEIVAESKLNQGSKFSFDLKLAIADEAEALAHEKIMNTGTLPLQSLSIPKIAAPSFDFRQLDKGTPAKMLRVLVVEDNPTALIVARGFLVSMKLEPTTAIDGESALELIKNQTFDLVLSDVGLPGISGIEFTKQLRAYEAENHQQPVPVIGLTAHAENMIHSECIESGMNEVIIKPIKREVLLEILGRFSICKPCKMVFSCSEENEAEQDDE